MLSKEEKEKAYWKGYITKQNEAMEICKQCKYIKKVKQLESDKQKLIEKLEEDIKDLMNQTKEKDLREKANYTLLYLSKYRKILKRE